MFEMNSAPSEEVFSALRHRAGFGDEKDLVEHVRGKYGEEEAERVSDEVTAEVNASVRQGLGQFERRLSSGTIGPKVDLLTSEAMPRAILLAIPDALFVEAIPAAYEHQIAAYGENLNSPPDPHPYVNQQLEQVGAPYRMDDGEMVWVGDELLHDRAIEPVIRVLNDSRLSPAAEEFGHAMTNLRIGSRKGRQDAVNDATRALEATMVAVLSEHSANLPDQNRRTVEPLWNALVAEGIAEAALKDVVTGGSRLSNKKTRHGPAGEVTQAEAETSVTAIANGINYLGNLLPSR